MSIQQEIATPRNKVAKKRTATQTIVYAATTCAFCIVLKWLSNVLSVPLPLSLKLSLAYLGWFVSAIVSGPVLGGCIAALSDVLGQFIMQTGGAPNVINMFGNFAATMVFGFIFHYLPTGKIPTVIAVFIKMVLGTIAFAVVGTLGINTFGLWIYYYSTTQYLAFLSTRFIQLIMLGINAGACLVIAPVLFKLGLVYPKAKKESKPESPAPAKTEVTPKASTKKPKIINLYIDNRLYSINLNTLPLDENGNYVLRFSNCMLVIPHAKNDD